QADILNLFKENPQKAIRQLEEAEYGAPMETILQNLSRAERRELARREEEAGADFIMETESYNPTPANGKKIVDYVRGKGKPITKQNLTVAMNHLVAAGDQALLRKVDEPTATTVIETPEPPTIVPSNQGRPEAEPAGNSAEFAREFAGWSLQKQQAY